MFLIDTDVLSALRKRKRHPEVAHWVEEQRSADLYLSVVSVREMNAASCGNSAVTRCMPMRARRLVGQRTCTLRRADSRRRFVSGAPLGPSVRLSAVMKAPTC